MAAIDKLFEFIPQANFVEKKNGAHDLRENKIGHIKLALVRETTNPIIIRSTDAEATITMISVDGRELVEIPPRKLKSREKLLGLMICREFNVINEAVRYNSFMKSEWLNNPNSLVFGDSVTQSGDPAALTSRAIYDWAYSLRDVKDITDKLQHNSMSEDGTIIKNKDVKPDGDGGVAPQSLHSTEYILPNTFFPHFITVDNISPELFVHMLSCVLNQHRYGAQTTTNANNITNHLVAVGLAPFEKPITSYTVSKAWYVAANKIEPPTIQSVKTLVISQMESVYGTDKILKDNANDKKIEGLISWIKELWDEKGKLQLKEIYTQAAKDCDAYLKSIKMITEGGSEKGKRSKKEKSKENTGQIEITEVNDESLPDIG